MGDPWRMGGFWETVSPDGAIRQKKSVETFQKSVKICKHFFLLNDVKCIGMTTKPL